MYVYEGTMPPRNKALEVVQRSRSRNKRSRPTDLMFDFKWTSSQEGPKRQKNVWQSHICMHIGPLKTIESLNRYRYSTRNNQLEPVANG